MNEREERLYGELLQVDATLKKPLAIVRYELSEREGIRVTDGILLMYEDKAVRYEDGALSGEITVDSISDVRLKTENGSVILLCNNDLLCRGVMRSKKEFAAFVKRLKYISEGKEYRSARYTSYCRGCGRAIEGESGLDFCMFCKPPRGTVKRLWRYTSGSRLFIFASVFCFFAVTLVGLLSPYVSKILVDDYIQPRNGYLTGFITVVLAMLSVSLLSRLIGILRSRLLTAASEKLIVRLRDDVFSKIQKLSVSNVARRTAGNLMHRVTRDTQEVQRIISNQLSSLIEQLLTLIGVSAIIITVEPLLSLIILIPIPIVFIAQRMFWSRVRRMYDMQWTAETAVETFLHDIFSGIRVVKSFGTEKLDEKKFHSMTDEECRISMRNEKFFAIFAPLVTYVITLGEIVLLYYVGSESIAGRMSLGDIAMYTSYVATVYGPIMWLGRQIRELSRGMRSAAKIFEILDEREDVPDNEAAERPPITGRIELKGVSFGYDESKEILHNISLSISPGEMIGVVGRSGVGKSTLINLIMRMYDPDEGEVLIDGVNAKDIPQEHLRASIGAVLQETFLFSGSIYDNIAYAKENATREEVLAASKLAGAHSFIMKLPDAYNTKVGERGYTLSGGERQRVTIARALLHDPRILILDEATSALDTETEKQIQDALAKLIKDRTTIAIAHRLSTLRNATRLIVIDEGRIAEEGTHEELMRLGGIYYSLVMAQRQMGSIKKKES